MRKAVLGSLSPVSIPPGAAVQARRSPERVLLFPESSTNTNPLGRAGASGGDAFPCSAATAPAKGIRAGAGR